MTLLDVREVRVSFGGITALDGASLQVDPGQVVGLIGPNGAGKTTLFNCVTRLDEPDGGHIVYDGHDLLAVRAHEVMALGIARTFQNLGLFPRMTVRDNVLVGAHHRTTAGFVAGPLRLRWVRDEERRLGAEVAPLLDRLGLAAVADHPADELPLGTLKRVELARALAGRPRLLLLDEPANGLNHEEVDELRSLVMDLREDHELSILVVEHHMAFVMGMSDVVVCLDRGRDIATGPPSTVQHDPQVVSAYLGDAA